MGNKKRKKKVSKSKKETNKKSFLDILLIVSQITINILLIIKELL